MLRIVFITHYSNFYGANRSLVDLIEGLKNYSISSLVICPSKGRLTNILEEKKIEYKIIPVKNWLTKNTLFLRAKLPIRTLYHFLFLPLLIKTVKRFGADIIYTNISCTPVGQLAASILKLPHVWHIREFGFEDFDIKCDYGEKVFKKLLNRADAVIAISEILKTKKLGFLNKSAYVIYDGVINKNSAEELDLTRTKKDELFSFVILGRIIKHKRQIDAIRAMSLLMNLNIRLYICGEGEAEYILHLKSLAEDLRISDKVIFTGFIENPFDILLKSDCLLMCSSDEAFGRVTAEAMFAGLPVIGYKGGATPELVEDNVNGLLYENGHEQLADCMKRLIDNPQLTLELGKRGRERALEYYTIERCASKIFEIINSLSKIK